MPLELGEPKFTTPPTLGTAGPSRAGNSPKMTEQSFEPRLSPLLAHCSTPRSHIEHGLPSRPLLSTPTGTWEQEKAPNKTNSVQGTCRDHNDK